MAFEEYVGNIVMEVDGQEIEVVSVTPTEMTGREPALAMSKAGTIVGYSEGVKSYSLEVAALIPKSGEPVDWANIVGAKITLQGQTGGQRTSYLNCVTEKVGRQFTVKGQAGVSISMFAQRKVIE